MTIEPHDRDASNSLFVAWAKLVFRFRWVVLLFSAASTAAACYCIVTSIRMDNSIEAFTASDSVDTRQIERFRDDFGRDDVFLMLVRGDVFTTDYLERLRKLNDEVAAMNLPLESLGRRSSRAARRRGAVTDKAPGPAGEPPPRMPGQGAAAEDLGAFEESGEERGEEPRGPGAEEREDGEAAAEDDDFGAFDEGPGDAGWGSEAGGSVVDEVISLVSVRRTSAESDGIRVGKWFDPIPDPTDLPALATMVLHDKTLLGQVVSADGRYSVVVVRTRFMSEDDNARVWRELKRIRDRHEAPGFHILVAGPPALGAALNTLMMAGFQRLMPLSVLAMLVLMAFVFRHPIGVLAPLAVVIQAALDTLGIMAAMDWPLTMLSLIVPSFLICVGIGDSVHYQSVYRQLRQRGVPNREALIDTLGTTGLPILFTSLTTMVGLLSFRFASTDAIQEMGTSGAMGVALALVHSVTFLPAVLSFNERSLLGARGGHADPDLLDRILAVATDFSHDEGARAGGASPRRTPRRFRSLVLAQILLLAAVGGALRLRVYHNPISWMPPGMETRDAFDALDEHLAGTATVSIMFDARRPGGIKSLALLRAMEKLDAHIRAFEHPGLPPGTRFVGNTTSILDVVKETNRALHGGDPAYYALPDSDRAVSDLLFMFENAGSDQLRRLVTNDMRKTAMTVRVRWVDATSYGPLIDYVEQGVDKYFGHAGVSADVITTGAVYSVFSVINMIVWDLVKSFGIAFVIIALLLMVMLRSVKMGILGMIPNLLPILATMGVMGVMGIPIDMVNLLLASIAIGIAVDDTIHYLHHFRSHYLLHGRVEPAIRYTLSHSGRALVSTSTVLAIGFAVFLSAQMYSLQRFGGLVALTVVLALVIDIVFTPALLRFFYKDFTPEELVPAGRLGTDQKGPDLVDTSGRTECHRPAEARLGRQGANAPDAVGNFGKTTFFPSWGAARRPPQKDRRGRTSICRDA